MRIKIVNTRDTDAKIVELEKLETIATDHAPISRACAVRELLLDHLNEKEENHVNEIINKCNNLFLPDEPLDHTDVIDKIFTDNRPINTIDSIDFLEFARMRLTGERFQTLAASSSRNQLLKRDKG